MEPFTRLFWSFPWVCAAGMTGLTQGILYEGRWKEGAARFLVRYALTVYPAYRGDVQPFLAVLTMPPET